MGAGVTKLGEGAAPASACPIGLRSPCRPSACGAYLRPSSLARATRILTMAFPR
jgi:hypothetical protein